jgi:hypothetical protein
VDQRSGVGRFRGPNRRKVLGHSDFLGVEALETARTAVCGGPLGLNQGKDAAFAASSPDCRGHTVKQVYAANAAKHPL